MTVGRSGWWRPGARGLAAVGLAALIWEGFARSGLFPPTLTPSLATVGWALGQMAADGSLPLHVLFTLLRVLCGLLIATAAGIPLGIAMGRSRWAERLLLPAVSLLMPIPSLAWVPLFILWFGLGNAATISLVVYAATFPVIFNAWSGVRSINQLWVRAAQAMGADGGALFRKVVLPGALPFIFAGVRQAFARAWIAVVGGEMIAATTWGLGFVIFDSREFLRTDVMMGALCVIGILGLVFERLVFGALEQRTVGRWGMLAEPAG